MTDSHKNHILPSYSENLSVTFEQIQELLSNSKNTEAKGILLEMHHADIADFLNESAYDVREQVIHILGSDFKPETLIWVNFDTRRSIENIATPSQIASWVEEIDTEDVIEVMESFSIEAKETILSLLTAEKQKYILEGFTYPEHTAGRVMETEFVSFMDHWTVGQSIDSIRHKNSEKDFHAAIIIDSRNKPVGNILLSTLLKHSRNTPIRQLMNEDFKIADTSTDLNQLSYIFKQYTLTIVPIVNKTTKKIVGTVSIDNMLYIVEQQTEENLMQLGGIKTQDIASSLLLTAKHRFSWLFLNLVTAFITSVVINQFSATIEAVVALAAIMPVVASMGGNAGTQAMTVTVRALSNKDITLSTYKKAVLKELMVCALNGVVLSALGASFSFILFGNTDLSMVFASAVIINFIVAGLFGSAIPIILDSFDIDPAASSGVLLTALTDSFGFFTFLTLAYVFLI
ncbi:MAG: magnesium transporter [Rickettsiaceae bacterium]|nr:magnesium transporter [Rickettsiaceae bacterium]